MDMPTAVNDANGGTAGSTASDGGDAGALTSPGGAPPSGEAGAGGEGGVIVLPPAVLEIHYTFDDLTSFVAEDETGNGNDGTLTGTSLPDSVEGILGDAIELDGTKSQYIALPEDILVDHDADSIGS